MVGHYLHRKGSVEICITISGVVLVLALYLLIYQIHWCDGRFLIGRHSLITHPRYIECSLSVLCLEETD